MESRDVHKENIDKNGWGYMVILGTVITFVAGIGHVNSFGLIYQDFMKDTHSSTKSLTSAYGVFAIMLAIGGIILNIIKRRFSLRIGGLFGAVLLTTGAFMTIFITNINHLIFTFGMLQGIGFGITVPVCYSTLNYYFVKKRTTVMSICKAVQGILIMWYPQLVRAMMSSYGFRGTLMIITGISLHVYPGMLIMRTDESKPRRIQTAKNDQEHGGKRSKENVDLLRTNNRNNSCDVTSNVPKRSEKTIFNKVGHVLMEILDFKILKDVIYCNILIGQSFVNFSDLTFFMLQPMLLFQYDYDKADVAMCISIGAAADLTGRCLLAFLSSIIQINTRLLYYLATLLTFVIRIAMLQITQFIWMAVMTAVLGMLRAWLHVTSPLLISNHVPHKDFPGAYAMSMLAAGIVNVTFSPFIGYLKDVYQDYTAAFYALTACCIPCLVLWPIECLFNRQQ